MVTSEITDLLLLFLSLEFGICHVSTASIHSFGPASSCMVLPARGLRGTCSPSKKTAYRSPFVSGKRMTSALGSSVIAGDLAQYWQMFI